MIIKSHNDYKTQEWETSEDPILERDDFLERGLIIRHAIKVHDTYIKDLYGEYPKSTCIKLIEIL